MEAKSFAYWLQGLFELSGTETLDKEQVKKIRNHLNLVFIYDIDPSYTDNEFVQQIMQNLHDGKDPLEGLKVSHKSGPGERPKFRPSPVMKC